MVYSRDGATSEMGVMKMGRGCVCAIAVMKGDSGQWHRPGRGKMARVRAAVGGQVGRGHGGEGRARQAIRAGAMKGGC